MEEAVVIYINILEHSFPAVTEKTHARSHNIRSQHVTKLRTWGIQTPTGTTVRCTTVYRGLAFGQRMLPAAYLKQFKTSTEQKKKN